jgi:signal peptidase II
MSADGARVTASQRWWLWLVLSAAIVVADQATKALVLSMLRPGEERTLTDFFSLVLAFNSGAAFSFLGDAAGWQRYLFAVIALIAACLIVWLLRRGGDRLYCAGLSLILGGALGNLCDRITLGKVVDFLSLHHYIPFRHPLVAWLDPFPAFNIADSAITVGAALLILDGFRRRPDPPAAVR